MNARYSLHLTILLPNLVFTLAKKRSHHHVTTNGGKILCSYKNALQTRGKQIKITYQCCSKLTMFGLCYCFCCCMNKLHQSKMYICFPGLHKGELIQSSIFCIYSNYCKQIEYKGYCTKTAVD